MKKKDRKFFLSFFSVICKILFANSKKIRCFFNENDLLLFLMTSALKENVPDGISEFADIHPTKIPQKIPQADKAVEKFK